MTEQTKAALDDIYEIVNNPLSSLDCSPGEIVAINNAIETIRTCLLSHDALVEALTNIAIHGCGIVMEGRAEEELRQCGEWAAETLALVEGK